MNQSKLALFPKPVLPLIRHSLILTWSAFIGLIAGPVRAQLLTDVPANAQSIKVDERLGLDIPKDLIFVDSNGEPTNFGKLCDGKRPVILTFNYSTCPGLCMAQLEGLTEGLCDMFGVALGSDFQLASICIDPADTPAKAAQFKSKYAERLTREHNPKAWHFLTGDAKTIRKMAESVGFGFSYDAKANRFNHGSVAVFLSPDGKITRYMYSVRFEPETLKLSLVEASEGKIGTTADQILLWCFHYNPEENRYSADAKRMLSFAAGAFVLVGLGISIPFWFSRPPLPPSSPQDDLTSASPI
jgi:protein SCO1/2